MKKILPLLLSLLLLCSCHGETEPQKKQYTSSFISLFDTMTTILGRADSEEEFESMISPIRDELMYYHRLFDIYNEYEGINNLKTLNDKAALSPVEVEEPILELLTLSIEYYDISGGAFNPAMGSVLSLWHEAREDGINDPAHAYLPNEEALREAAEHMNPHDIVIDPENSTVFFADPHLKLDVGAIAKGWATERVLKKAPSGLLVSVGGNVRATGPKTESGTAWGIGIKDPFGKNGNLHVLDIQYGSVVTSGSYQRAYAVDGKPYHHIIDPRTLYPSTPWTSVTVVTEDSGLADMLSTALFILDREAGLSLLDRFDAEAMWVDGEGNQYYSPDFRALIRNSSR